MVIHVQPSAELVDIVRDIGHEHIRTVTARLFGFHIRYAFLKAVETLCLDFERKIGVLHHDRLGPRSHIRPFLLFLISVNGPDFSLNHPGSGLLLLVRFHSGELDQILLGKLFTGLLDHLLYLRRKVFGDLYLPPHGTGVHAQLVGGILRERLSRRPRGQIVREVIAAVLRGRPLHTLSLCGSGFCLRVKCFVYLFPPQHDLTGFQRREIGAHIVFVNLGQLRVEIVGFDNSTLDVLPVQQLRRFQPMQPGDERVIGCNGYGVHQANLSNTVSQRLNVSGFDCAPSFIDLDFADFQ